MAQILPESPSFGTQFARALGGGFSKGIENSREFQQKMAIEKQKQEYKSQLAQQSSQIDQQKKQQEIMQEVNEISSLINDAKELLPYTGSQKIPGSKNWEPFKSPTIFGFMGPNINRGAVQKRTDIDALGSILADKLYTTTLKNKGPLSEDRIEKLMNKYKLDANDSERAYQGKIDAMEKLLKAMQAGFNADEAFKMLGNNKESSSSGTVTLYLNGEAYDLPKKEVKQALKDGFKTTR